MSIINNKTHDVCMCWRVRLTAVKDMVRRLPDVRQNHIVVSKALSGDRKPHFRRAVVSTSWCVIESDVITVFTRLKKSHTLQ